MTVTNEGGIRRAAICGHSEPVAIGPIEKMSKSRRNTVDPDDIIDTYGADTARWFMLSDSPPERDVIWSEEGVQGAARFMQRLWRLIADAKSMIGDPAPVSNGAPIEYSVAALGIRKAAHRALSQVEHDIDNLRFNVCIAHIRELANCAAGCDVELDERQAALPIFEPRSPRPCDILVLIAAPMAPHLAEECWQALGYDGLVASAALAGARAQPPRPRPRSPCRFRSTVRSERTSPSRAKPTEPRSEAAVLSLEAVRRAMEGRVLRKFILVPGRIVNVVV